MPSNFRSNLMMISVIKRRLYKRHWMNEYCSKIRASSYIFHSNQISKDCLNIDKNVLKLIILNVIFFLFVLDTWANLIRTLTVWINKSSGIFFIGSCRFVPTDHVGIKLNYPITLILFHSMKLNHIIKSTSFHMDNVLIEEFWICITFNHGQKNL